MSNKKIVNHYFIFLAPPAGIEPAHMAPEAIALSTELRGRYKRIEFMKLWSENQIKNSLTVLWNKKYEEYLYRFLK